MKRGIKLMLLVFIVLLFLQIVSAQTKSVLYTQYNAARNTFWTNLNENLLDDDFTRIKEYGFDSIIVEVHFGDFFPKIGNINAATPQEVTFQTNPVSFTKLQNLVRKAKNNNLKVSIFFNIGNNHEFYQDSSFTIFSTRICSTKWLVYYGEEDSCSVISPSEALFSDWNVYGQFYTFVAWIANSLKEYDNVNFYWLDYQIATNLGNLPLIKITELVNIIKTYDSDAVVGYKSRQDSSSEYYNINSIDLVLIENYPQNNDVSVSNIISEINYIRQYTQKPIYLAETGISTSPCESFTYGEENQRKYFENLISSMPNLDLEGYNIWMWRDYSETNFLNSAKGNICPNQRFQWEGSFGLLKQDSCPKPAAKEFYPQATCPSAGECSNIGNRQVVSEIPYYCDISGTFLQQKADGESCDNDYECMNNLCSNNECVNIYGEVKEKVGLIRRIICAVLYKFLSNNEENYQQCLAE